jgi:hypothetical protein
MGRITNAIAKAAIKRRVKRVLQRPEIPVDNDDADFVADLAADEAVPVILHQTNQEPWYQSRVTLGAIVAIGSGFATLGGFSVDESAQRQILDTFVGVGTIAGSLGAVLGGVTALWGRWVARRPLGT